MLVIESVIAGLIGAGVCWLFVSWLHKIGQPRPIAIRQPLPTCTALPSAWRADKERVVAELERAWDR